MSGELLARKVAESIGQGRPASAVLEVTRSCNLRCRFCYNPRTREESPLTLDEWLRVLDELRDLGVLTITLTGGEPLAHPDFFAIAGGARRRGFALYVMSNGTLVDEATADRLAELYPLGVDLSLHGATATTHDETTGVPGSFAALQRAIALLGERQVRLRLKHPVTRLNEGETTAVVELAAALRLPLVLDASLTPRDDGDRSPLSANASEDGVLRMLACATCAGQNTPVRRQAGQAVCGVGQAAVAIDPEGNVLPCLAWRTRLGNLRESSLAEIWPGSARRRDIIAAAVQANDHLLRLGGAPAEHFYCPALAAALTGDPCRPDERFLRYAELAAQARRRAV